jgi:hypothetical protein
VNAYAEDLHNLHSHDFVLNAGANDIYKNNKRVALTQVTKFVQGNYGANIIILRVPLRYELPPSSYVNSQINEYNRTLKKITTQYNHVLLLETSRKRECFMRHGLRWNSLGKTLVEKLILLQISKILGKEPQAPINLAWTDNV